MAEAGTRVVLAIGPSWLDPQSLLDSAGTWALYVAAAILFAETGLLIGFFLPGDTLLFSVGLLASQGVVTEPFWFVLVLLWSAAMVGNVVGYEIGRRAGPPLLRGDHRVLTRERVERTQNFFAQYGAPAIVLARFVPVVRTFITVVAGAAGMHRRHYLVYSAVGGVIWVFSLTSLGYFLGTVPFVRDHVQPHLDLILLGVVVLSILPVIIHLLRERRSRGKRAAAQPTPSSDKPKAKR